MGNSNFDVALADQLGDVCSILCQLDKIHDRYHNMGSPLVRSPFWNCLALSSIPSDPDFIMEPIEPPNNFVESSVGKFFYHINIYSHNNGIFRWFLLKRHLSLNFSHPRNATANTCS